ncbi:hypothetical protein FRB93_006427 [Tulasnella sp. JGI-2019a]|nr:hypothetical protein FRB93_006427 [Tulasnella sp. JGI-2019a]
MSHLITSYPPLYNSLEFTTDVAKDGLDILLTLLDTALIPEPFKSAVTVIPNIAMQILTIVGTVEVNAEDAKALAIYIANMTKIAMRPFKTKPQGSLDSGLDMKKQIDNFREVFGRVHREWNAGDYVPKTTIKGVILHECCRNVVGPQDESRRDGETHPGKFSELETTVLQKRFRVY